MVILRFFTLIILVVFSIEINGQKNDTIILLEEFTKITRLNNTKSYNKTLNLRPNKTELNNSTLDELLSSKSAIFIKSYGPGYLSSISLRGGNAQQTSIIWNGFIINSPLNGISDLSTIPNSFIDDINIQFGNSAALWGNGGISGAIHLSNNYKFNDSLKIKIGSSIGSFSNFKSYFNVSKGFKKWHTSVRFFHNKNENDFTIYNSSNNQTSSQSNSRIYQLSFMNENYFQLNNNSFLKIIGLYQQYERQIPPTLDEQGSLAKQNDYITRFFSEYKLVKNLFLVNIKSSYFNTINDYFDPISSIVGINPSTSFLNEIDLKNKINNTNQISFSIMNSYCFSNGNNFSQKINQNRWSATFLYNWKSKNKKWSQSLNTRQVINDNKFTPLTFSYGINWKPSNKLNFYGNIGKLYRLPTINDLYWSPGGNIDLQPENGYSNDIGAIFSLHLSKSINISFEPSLFNRKINNWIIWYPNGSFWSPQNILKVWSRGIETTSNISFQKKFFLLDINFNSSYVISTNQETNNSNDRSLGKQLIYTPYYVFNFFVKLNYKKIGFKYNHTYNGYRYTSSDNMNLLYPFNIANISLSYSGKINEYSTKIFYKLNNAFNENYQLILNRPMPLINHEIGINLIINK